MTSFLGYDMEPGLIPLVVGVVSTPEGLEKAADRDEWPCDVIEIRLDLIGPDFIEWSHAANCLTRAGMGTLLTIRHINEGGRWSGDEMQRRDLYLDNIHHVSGIDVELKADILPEIVRIAGDRVSVIGSYHSFRGMPEAAELDAVLKSGVKSGVDVVKIAAFASDRSELGRLKKVVESADGQAVCALAMGPMADVSRIELPVAGSCLTYGYFDRPNAPGQPAVQELREKLMEAHEEYRTYVELQSA